MNKYKYIALTALALGLAACSQEDDFTPQGNQKNAPLAIASAGVAELSTRANISSDNKLVEGAIGVFVKTTTEDTRYKGSNLEWKYSEGWTAEGTTVVRYEADGTKQTIGAYYPYSTELTDGTYPINLPATYGSDYEDYDYLYADYTALNTNPVSITMNHLLSKVSVNISSVGSEIEDGEAVTGISLTNVSNTASWSVPSGKLTPVGEANQTVALYGDGGTYVGYVVPNGAKTITISVTTKHGTTDIERTFRATASLDGEMTQGEHYKISLRLGKDKVTVTNIGIAKWNDTEVTGGTAEECTEHTWEDGVCTHCELACQHPATTKGICNVCQLNIGYDYDAAANAWSLYNGAAFELALEKGGTVTLCADFTASLITIDIAAGKETTLDLNGKTVHCDREGQGGYDFRNEGTLTIKDSAGEGKLYARIWNRPGGTLVKENGFVSYIQNSGAGAKTTVIDGTGEDLLCYTGTMTIQGGTYTGRLDTANSDGTMTITGGTFSTDPTAYVPEEGYTVTDNGNGTYTVTAETAGE